MNKKIWFLLPVLILLFWLARSWYWEHELSKEEVAVRGVLLAQESRFRDVRVYRSKSNYNLVEGQVARSEDVEFLEREMARLNIRRCILAVRADNAMKRRSPWVKTPPVQRLDRIEGKD